NAALGPAKAGELGVFPHGILVVPGVLLAVRLQAGSLHSSRAAVARASAGYLPCPRASLELHRQTRLGPRRRRDGAAAVRGESRFITALSSALRAAWPGPPACRPRQGSRGGLLSQALGF